ncbi:hypothetical protein [Paenibacillus hexagrammi]|uniref:Uncharacterized protein n=1 Tax=Paenibacillus hexagrammi TaxID=2908839 RepID=A0ABY3SHG8_9BACL|nr:hypothetical protein [Paenibacillus sp. YPD9-1]UJF32945.1 hypothetical protein L0M14_25765 [Paenibacillus sp. YPD9-1]
MKRVSVILLVIGICCLSFWAVMPYQYGVSAQFFYGMLGLSSLFNIYGMYRLWKHGPLKPLLLTLLALATLYNAYEAVHEQPNFMLKEKLSAYTPNAPLKIVYQEELGASSSQTQENAIHELNQKAGGRTVFLQSEIKPPRAVTEYTVIYKNRYIIDDVDVSKHLCMDHLFCTYQYAASVQVDSVTGELLGYFVYDKGMGK